MPKTNLKIVSTDTYAKTVNTTVSDINPNLDTQQARELALKLNAFTTNTYDHTEKITTTNLDTEIKSQRNLRLYFKSDSIQVSPSNPVVNAKFSDFAKTGDYWKFIFNVRTQANDGDILTDVMATFTSFNSTSSEVTAFTQSVSWTSSINNPTMGSLWSITVYLSALVATTLVGHLHIPETDNYAAYDKDITFNITDDTEG